MEKECVKAILKEKEKDEMALNSEITAIIRQYSDKWDSPKIEIDVTSDWFTDCNFSIKRTYIINVRSTITL